MTLSRGLYHQQQILSGWIFPKDYVLARVFWLQGKGIYWKSSTELKDQWKGWRTRIQVGTKGTWVARPTEETMPLLLDTGHALGSWCHSWLTCHHCHQILNVTATRMNFIHCLLLWTPVSRITVREGLADQSCLGSKQSAVRKNWYHSLLSCLKEYAGPASHKVLFPKLIKAVWRLGNQKYDKCPLRSHLLIRWIIKKYNLYKMLNTAPELNCHHQKKCLSHLLLNLLI